MATQMDMPSLRYLSAQAVARCLPPPAARVELAARALVALGSADAEMPPKVGVHPRPGALLHAMPAWLRSDDVVGMKWVSLFPDNKRNGLPAISGLIVLNDPASGLPTWLLDAAVITAARTAAVSGVAIRLFAPAETSRLCIVGAGVQGHSHLELLAGLQPNVGVVVHDRHPERAQALAAEFGPRFGAGVEAIDDVRQAIAGAEVVITAAGLARTGAFIEPDWLAPGALVVAIDFAGSVSGAVAGNAGHFVTDDREQYLAYRAAGWFDGYPEAVETMGEAIAARGLTRTAGTDERPVLVNHLGVGLADVIFADAIAGVADERGEGQLLER
jgi:alanine dehydrogenase